MTPTIKRAICATALPLLILAAPLQAQDSATTGTDATATDTSSTMPATQAEGTIDADIQLPLTQDVRQTSADWLQRITYDFIALQHNVHQAHWNVTGIEYYQLHEFYGELYATLQGFIDASAERKLHLGISADGRPSATAANSDVPELSPGFVGDTESLKFLAENYSVVSAQLYAAIDATSDDMVTQDLLIGFTHEIDKGFWQLREHLQTPGESAGTLPAGTATGNGDALISGETQN